MKRIDPIDRHIGTRIRMRRHELGVTQEWLGQELGLTFQQVQKYEKGSNRVGGSRMAQIARTLGVDVGYFYHDAPGTIPETVARDGLVDSFMATKDGLMIAQAFVRIANPDVRHHIASFIDRLSRSHDHSPMQAAE